MLALPVLQIICANFFAPATGTYGDHTPVTVTTAGTIATVHGVTGYLQGTTAGTQCTTFDIGQVVARIDFQVVGVDPGDELTFEKDGVAFPLETSGLLINPDVTAQPLTATGGVLTSVGPDGSAVFEMGTLLTSFEFCVTAPAGHDGVVIRPTTQAFCQCGNGHKHFNEDCDDGDTDSGDGCSSMCAIEEGWSCTGVYNVPSVCVMPPDASVPDAMPPPPDAMVPDAGPPDATPPPPDAAIPDDAALADAPPIDPDAALDDAGGGFDATPIPTQHNCACQGGADPGGLALLAVALALLRRRRRERCAVPT